MDEQLSDADFWKVWKSKTQRVCKPCWELKYCPYGPIVEDFPLLPTTLEEAIEHHRYLLTCLDGDCTPDGRSLSPERRRSFKRMLREFSPDDHPPNIPEAIADMACTVFGHICPIVYGAEGFTETAEARRQGRYISFKTKVRVVRRDNYTCQHCSTHLRDDEVEFDHIIRLQRAVVRRSITFVSPVSPVIATRATSSRSRV